MSRLAGERVLVTGGAGFIGSHVVDGLVAEGAEVVVLDDLSSGLRENLAGVGDEVTLIEGDILDREALDEAMRGASLVSHQAAQLEITRALDDPMVDVRTNTQGTIEVMEAAARHGVRRVVSASSACIYGQARSVPQNEDHPTDPNWEYGVSKLAAEKYLEIIARRTGVEGVSLRYAIVYGEREWYGRALTAFLSRVVDGEAPVVFGRGDVTRDYVHVSDVARMNLACLTHPAAAGESFNVSTGIGTSIRGMASLVCELDGSGLEPVTEEIAEGERSELLGGRMRLPAELHTMILGNDKARALLGFAPLVGVREGVARELEWVRTHRERWTAMSY